MSRESSADLLIIGGGTGGCAAALAACELGLRVILTEETDWLGGQFTSQGVPPDEHRWIESHGCTAGYRRLRDGIRAFYRANYPLASDRAALNPGAGWVSDFCCEPRVALAALEAMLAPHITAGRLDVRLRHRPTDAETEGDRVAAVTVLDTDRGTSHTLSAPLVVDATETGELLAMAGCEHVTGSEAQSLTGEPHAGPIARPDNVQAITWCLAMGYDPTGEHVIDRPATYGFWRDYVPRLTPAWPGRLRDWTYANPVDLSPRQARLLASEPEAAGPPLFTYRRIVCRDTFVPGFCAEEATLVNWPQNDYLVDSDPADAREVSLSLLYWLQTEAPRPDGGHGYPGLRPRGDLLGTRDGLAKAPYHRESRRILAEFTVTEIHVGQAARGSLVGAEPFADSVGIGAYRIDLHPTLGGDNYLDVASWPFQIPLGALLPRRLNNLLPAAKNIGTTHITNGCYRLHPVEWNIGEAVGALAAFCLGRGEPPRAVRAKPALLADYQRLLSARGVELAWPAEVAPL
ncbi:MAG: FAD-dependent oxidoreductase [Armatimonadetes bacterium]|nr:FAD-dependent oxidoreductase [Armatimonadota bacterium]